MLTSTHPHTRRHRQELQVESCLIPVLIRRHILGPSTTTTSYTMVSAVVVVLRCLFGCILLFIVIVVTCICNRDWGDEILNSSSFGTAPFTLSKSYQIDITTFFHSSSLYHRFTESFDGLIFNKFKFGVSSSLLMR